MKIEYKTMIYPFDIESVPLIRHSKLVNKYNIVYAISPNGWGLTGKDAGYADGGQSTGMIIDNDFDKALESCDTVFFTHHSMKTNLSKLIYPKIIKAAENSKNILCTIKLEDEIIDKIRSICNKNNKFFKYFMDTCNNIEISESEKIYPVNAPVIFVAGLEERTHKFEIQLNLRENLQKMGYKVSQVGTRHYCELMEFHSFPKFMYSKSITESEKVTLFNHYIKNIEIKEKPDIIVIGIPGGIMPFNYEFTNRFGILAYEVSQAVIPDAVVLSMLYKNYTPEFFELLLKSLKYKFGYNVDCFNIVNASLNIPISRVEGTLQYITMDWNFINEKKKIYSELDSPVYNILDTDDAKSMSDLLVDKLAKYGENQII
ncbi:TIGR04066 family peptide maturation system protein [Clostridium botulinum]|uniref:TIGR04066 family peptide maturation system protein n=1 Tax=Clostridium botulinum TaxID=1491 RepID=A0A6B4S6Z6_CLOBO|nr:TIGR04066 family peptide maturation system protein [Clostridium botulinum]NFE59418.1 TIGR04066 family peptide maturation system protein [Clostridium botulinum]NFE74549.1 TIGR04066 family peptide maturation system protein [Clostridium botulinum]NFE94787.1 TIGR04066 family peptide maturation system protein [Clostridium botulinum]NFF88956.1 TIGR04066 family peptide maturation system protein [Clostridium botulinum]NFG11420.1 TIGR04066 family peptide maturation system protein [Clostridium botuli